MPRVTITETMLGDQRIEPGQVIIAWIGSANRDEAEFPDPNRFDIEREHNRHIGLLGPPTKFTTLSPHTVIL